MSVSQGRKFPREFNKTGLSELTCCGRPKKY